MRRILPLLAALSMAFAPAPLSKAPPKGRGEARGETKTVKEVMLWLVEESGKQYVGSLRVGYTTVTFPGPKGTKYSTSDVIAILNRHLRLHGLVLIECERYFVFICEDDLPAWR
jgi:hypothetical protein